MNKLLASVLVIAFAVVFAPSANAGYVNGYQRDNGTYVNGYYRSNPDGYTYNNYNYGK